MDNDLDQRLSQLMALAQDGNRGAYETLLRETKTLAFAFIKKRVPSLEWVDDIVQETLISIHSGRHTYDPRQSYCGWMYTITHHRLIDYARKQRRILKSETTLQNFESVSENRASCENAILFFDQALNLLSRKQRAVIGMLKLEGCSVKEVSEKMRMSESAVKVSAHRGYRILQKWVSEGEF